MNRIAIISDVHGNLEALNTALNDIKHRDIDTIYCLGDIIAKGSHHEECIKIVKDNCKIILRGNCDEYFSKDIDLSDKTELQIKRINWNKNKLSNEAMDYLRNLPFCYEFYMSGRLIRLFHAHPEKNDKIVGNIDKIDRMYELFLPSENTISKDIADVIIYGHLHTPYVQNIYGRTIINTGSIGNSLDIFRNDEKDGNIRNITVANYLILNGVLDSKNNDLFSYEIVSVPYDIDKELENNNDNIEFDLYKDELKNGKYRNMEAVFENLQNRGIDIDRI